MIPFSLRQFRPQTIVAGVGLVIVAVVAISTGPHLVHIYDSAVSACRASGGASPLCNNPVGNADSKLQVALAAVVLIVPVLIGMFWGAPLIARELEAGTVRLAWTQSVTRKRWLLTKLGIVAAASALVAGLLSLMFFWWVSPIDDVNQNRFSPFAFSLHGIVPIGYAIFAFAVGVTTGVLFRRTLPAMATTLVVFIFCRIAVTDWIRPHLMSPKSLNFPFSSAPNLGISVGPAGGPAVVAGPPNLPNGWVLSTNVVNNAGQSPSSSFLQKACPNLPGISNTPVGNGLGRSKAVVPSGVQNLFRQCMAEIGTKYHVAVVYQPASRFWAFQWYETAIFVAAALALFGATYWWVRHRLP
jgi:ABC-2 family transporter protein